MDWTGIKKLSVPVLVQLSEDLARAVIEYNRSLRHELECNRELKAENQLSREFISLTLSIEHKQQQQQQLSQLHVDPDDNSFTTGDTSDGMVCTTYTLLFINCMSPTLLLCFY